MFSLKIAFVLLLLVVCIKGEGDGGLLTSTGGESNSILK